MKDNITKFAILFLARSGSTWMSSLLASHPSVFVGNEILVDYKDIAGQIKRAKASFAIQKGYQATGFQVKLSDIKDLDDFDSFLLENDAKIIFLERNNVVKKAISHFNAVRLNDNTGDWNLYSEKDRLGKLEIDPDVFRERLALTDGGRKWARNAVERMKSPRLDLIYEELLADTSGTMKPVFDFLGVEEQQLESNVLKNTPDDLSKIVKNYDELRNMYKGTGYEKMFD